MGVPVITRAGQTHASRVGVSLLNAVALGDLVATDEAGYVAAAARLAQDRTRLAEMRVTLRDRMRRSPLMAAEGFTRHFESALRDMLWSKKQFL
jgi:predicted O-linked N-acetylglucosamine transferase (SPINDLY family)